MLAKKTSESSTIDAVELDSVSAEQCHENFANSPWAPRLHIHTTSIQNYEPSLPILYDCIISNPPFYSKDAYPKFPDPRKDVAMRQTELTFPDLLQAVSRLLQPGGSFYVLLPPLEAKHFCELALTYHLFGQSSLSISHDPTKTFHRSIYQYKKLPFSTSLLDHHHVLSIKEPASDAYSADFRDLLFDYYSIF